MTTGQASAAAGGGGGGEWELVRAAQRGDAAAFGELYSRYAGGVSCFLGGRVRDRHLVEDLTSETFLRGWRRIDSVSEQGKDVGAWFTTIARNLLFDHTKSSRHQRETSVAEITESPGIGAGAAEGGPERAVVDRETAARVRRHVAQLTPDQRQAIEHRFFQDRSVPETAAVMGRRVAGVKSLTHRAVTSLRASLTAEDDDHSSAPGGCGGAPLARAARAVAAARQRVAAGTEGDRARQRARSPADHDSGARGVVEGDARAVAEEVA